MFIKTAGFKKILKEAYKGRGLHIGATENTVYASGGYWAIEVYTKEIPKEKLAAIIELTGFIPDPGEQCLINKDEIQMEITENPFYNVIENAERAHTEMDVTRLLITAAENNMRVLQTRKNKEIVLIKDLFIQMIDNSEVNEPAGHTSVEGPFIDAIWKQGIIYFCNNIMAMAVMPAALTGETGERLISHLSTFDFSKGKDNGPDVSEEDEEETEEES